MTPPSSFASLATRLLTRRNLAIAIPLVLLAGWFAIRMRFPWIGGFDLLVFSILSCITYGSRRRDLTATDVNGDPLPTAVNKAFQWVANGLVCLLIFVWLCFYFGAAYETNFSALICAINAAMIVVSTVFGSLLRKYFSRTSLLAYALSFTICLFLSLAIWGLLIKTVVPLRTT